MAISLTMLFWVGLPATTEFEEQEQLGISDIACLLPLLEYEEKVPMGLVPEEFSQFLYPETEVPRPYILELGLSCIFYPKK